MPDAKMSPDAHAFAKTRMKIEKESWRNHSMITIRKIDFKSGI